VPGRNVALQNVKSYLEREHDDRFSLITYHTQRLDLFLYPLLYRLQRDDAVYQEMYRKDTKIPTKDEFGRLIEINVILPNHEAILALIDKNSSLIGSSKPLRTVIEKYQRHLAVLQALRQKGDFSDPYIKSKEAGYPTEFSKVVENEIDSSNEVLARLRVVH
jgi:hypothetical protein